VFTFGSVARNQGAVTTYFPAPGSKEAAPEG